MSSYQGIHLDHTTMYFRPDQDEAATEQDAFERNTRLLKLGMIGAGLFAAGVAGLLALVL